MKKKTKKRKGFSMLEALLSMAIVSIGLVGALALLSRTTRESMDVRDQVIGGMLAQEGVEIIRNMRDNKWATSTPQSGFSFISAGNPFACDYKDLDATSDCYSGGGKVLYLDNDGYYNHDGGTQTKFFRRIGIAPPAADADKRMITSMVRWGSGGFPNVADCNASAKCAYTRITLSEWGE